MADIEQLRVVFERFCNFGASKGSTANLSGSMSNLSGPTIDNAKFAKLCRDTKVVGGAVSTVDVDNAFMKVKSKTARKIDFGGFQQALGILATKKYPSKTSEEALSTLARQIVASNGPATTNTTQANASGVYSKLTDSKLYTGAHKSRFDENGNGRGLEGRLDRNTRELSTLVSRDPAVKKRDITLSMEALGGKTDSPKVSRTTNVAETRNSNYAISNKTTAAPKNPNAAPKSSATSSDVYSRLTNTKGYTGTHAHRFDASGKGLGLAGRSSPSKGTTPGAYRGGDVKDLSQILRS